MVLSTPNRTLESRVLLVGAAEALGAVPRGTHHWDDFVTPEELGELLAAAGLAMGTPRGIHFSPLHGLQLSDNLSLDFIVTAARPRAIALKDRPRTPVDCHVAIPPGCPTLAPGGGEISEWRLRHGAAWY